MQTIRHLLLALTTAVLALTNFTASAQNASTNRPHYLVFEHDIQVFEAQDRTNPPPQNAIVFVGSSSIRKWTNAQAQFPQHQIINRGFGGSFMEDSVAFVDRIVTPYHPQMVVLYAGDNDIASGQSAQKVFDGFKEFVAKVQKKLPQTTIAYLAIKPSSSRTKFLAEHREANRLIQEFIGDKKNLVYVDTFTPMMTAEGKVRDELFVGDRLHLNEQGYQVWAGIVGPWLDKRVPAAKK